MHGGRVLGDEPAQGPSLNLPANWGGRQGAPCGGVGDPRATPHRLLGKAIRGPGSHGPRLRQRTSPHANLQMESQGPRDGRPHQARRRAGQFLGLLCLRPDPNYLLGTRSAGASCGQGPSSSDEQTAPEDPCLCGLCSGTLYAQRAARSLMEESTDHFWSCPGHSLTPESPWL